MKVAVEEVKSIVDEVFRHLHEHTPGGEDFHYYTLKRPKVKATMLGLGCDLSPGLHHPKMSFNKESLLTGIEIIVRAVFLSFERLEQRV